MNNEINNIISGALFDFMAMLTTGETVYTFSEIHEAGPAVAALREFAEKRGLQLDEAQVANWTSALTTRCNDAADAEKWRKLVKQMTFYDTKDSAGPVLAAVSARIWYHATDNLDYPLDAVVDAMSSEQPK